MTERRLRVGLLLESPDVPAWVWAAIRDVSTSPNADVVVVGQLPSAAASRDPRRGPTRTVLRRLDDLLDRSIPADQDAFATKNAQSLLAGVHVQPIRRAADAHNSAFAAEDVAALRAMDLDVLLCFEPRPLHGEILRAARAGVWSFDHGDHRVTRGGPAGFWEVHEGRPVTGAALHIVAEAPEEDRTLARANIATIQTSVKRTRNAAAWAALALLEGTLRELSRDGHERLLARVARDSSPVAFYSNRLFGPPSLGDLVVNAARRLARVLRLAAERVGSRRQWILYYGMADDLIQACWRLRPLVPPIDTFWADPHVVRFKDRYFVFVEEVQYATGKGHISVIEIDGDGQPGPARRVLEEPHHLSYPFVFEHDGAYYMVPESSAGASIDLYRATAFPDEWKLVEHLMTGVRAVDATLLRDEDRWWLFANVVRYPGADAGQLNLYTSDRLVGGDWRLHPASPLSSDVRGSRPAGAILRRNGRLYRPGQDGSGAYGRAIVLNEILELTMDAYREVPVSTIEPDWDDRISRTHTLAHAGRLTVLDGLWLRSRWSPQRWRPRTDEPAPSATDRPDASSAST